MNTEWKCECDGRKHGIMEVPYFAADKCITTTASYGFSQFCGGDTSFPMVSPDHRRTGCIARQPYHWRCPSQNGSGISISFPMRMANLCYNSRYWDWTYWSTGSTDHGKDRSEMENIDLHSRFMSSAPRRPRLKMLSSGRRRQLGRGAYACLSWPCLLSRGSAAQ